MSVDVLSPALYQTVYAAFSLCLATMLGAFVFFLASRQDVAPRYRKALTTSAVVVGVAAYHYWRIFHSWGEAYTLQDGAYVASGVPFNDAYRYADWLLTVPLLMVELVSVLDVKRKAGLFARLIVATVLMIATGYVGEIAADMSTRNVWGLVSTVPFLYILYVLFFELTNATQNTEDDTTRTLFFWLRVVLIATWGVYPIAYLLPIYGIGGGAGSFVGVQLGYTLADITAKAGFGLLIYAVARHKTDVLAQAGEPAAATAVRA